MKVPDSFDARRLRPRRRCSVWVRLAGLLALTLCCAGLLLTATGLAALAGQASAELAADAGGPLTAIGLALLLVGLLLWRRIRRSGKRSGALCLSPGLLKKWQ